MIRPTKDTSFRSSAVIEMAVVVILSLSIAVAAAWPVVKGFRASVDHTVAVLDGDRK
jgi:uncharacterized protein YpuA (DUF1002 family)